MSDSEDPKTQSSDQAEDDLLLANTPMSRGPLLWFAILALPLMLGLVFSFDNVTQERSAVVPEQRELEEVPKGPEMISGYELNTFVSRQNKRGTRDENIFCPTKALTGERFTVQVDEMLQASKRPYRIVDNQKMYQKDFVANRINLQLGANSIIQSVWCG